MIKTVVCMSMLATLAVSGTQADVSTSSAGGWWGDLYEQKVIPLEAVLKKPRSFVGQTVTFIGQFHRLGEIDNPFYTKFESEWYLNFSIWPEGAALWDKKVYKDDYQYLFVRRGSEGAKALLQAPRYSRFVIVAEVSDVFKDKPWFDVTGLKRLETQMTEASLVHIVKGRTLMRVKRHEAATKELMLADGPRLPTYVRTMLLREQATALHAMGKTSVAISRLQAAHSLNPSDKVTNAQLAMIHGQKKSGPEEPDKRAQAKEGAGDEAKNEKPATGKGADASSKEAKVN